MRRLARETAFQIIYQVDVGNNFFEDALKERINESVLDAEGKKFCERLARGTHSNLQNIDNIIESVAIDWKIDRMLSVDRNLLRVAVFEMQFCEDIPEKVALNEAIEMAKIFGSDDSPKFINGILGKLIKQGE